MEYTKQAYVIAIVYVLCLAIGLFLTIKAKKFSIAVLISFIVSLCFVGLLAYDTTCLSYGNCGTWSWVRTGLYVFFPTIALIALAISVFKGEPDAQKSLNSLTQTRLS